MESNFCIFKNNIQMASQEAGEQWSCWAILCRNWQTRCLYAVSFFLFFFPFWVLSFSSNHACMSIFYVLLGYCLWYDIFRLLDMYLDPQNGKEPMFKAAVRLLHSHGESLDPLQVLEVLNTPTSSSHPCTQTSHDTCLPVPKQCNSTNIC